MPRVIGIDPGTVSIDLVGLENGRVWLDRSLPTREALADPDRFIALLTAEGPVDCVAGPSGYGLPLVPAAALTDSDLRLAYLASPDEDGGIGGLRRLARLLAAHRLPVVFTPGVIHLPTVPDHRKLNRVDLGTADKVAAAALGIWDQGRRSIKPSSFILLELGGAFTAALAVDTGRIVDGIGGTSGPMGRLSSGGWDGEVAYLAGQVQKAMLFRGGAASPAEGPTAQPDAAGRAAWIEGACKAVLALTVSLPGPREILLSGRHAADPGVRSALETRLGAIAPVRDLVGYASVAKQGAQGAALLADGLAGGESAVLVETMALRRASGTVLDYLRVISPDDARRRLGLTPGG
jgi:predicted butyrate kinase (DUF1464 family)